ncbi:p115 like vesicle tethering protein [Plectosphaerella plurivora]|uniref:P115 like vesicle tethering protein n=1 Tax=Plectosphaerella plurivora TaxID=936078 RepID=A0A9P8V6K5_9PEZI|nr:p115 like vesicle tethering protein [Plectosphaerella plurivora]
MFSIAPAPAKQSVGETISVLSGRLSSATLLEDRRAAILGLRSFAKDYPATVASGALRSLIGSLTKDGEDVDTVKVVLETLLMLFNPSDDSPEASEELVLWLADEFTQRQENITLLLDFLESSDFYPRLYALQLLTAILSSRTERTEECIFTAPLGVSHLVAILDDQREAIRNEAVTLLIYLTPSSMEVQKLVAFENAFDRIFAIIISDGSLRDGSQTVEDCLILLANLLRRNTSNQSLFRESGGVKRLSQLLEQVLQAEGEEEGAIASWAEAQRNRNIYAMLALVRLLLVDGAVGTQQNQNALWQYGLLYHALQLSFSRAAQTPIKAEALVTCADIIRGNSTLQESFAQLQVPAPVVSTQAKLGQDPGNSDDSLVYVIDGLLDMTLSLSALDTFDMRRAACDCLKAYMFQHADIRLHFLKRAIEGYQAGADENSNVLTVLLRPTDQEFISNPYRVWFAAAIMFHLLFDQLDAKSLALTVTEGDAESGEEVVTSVQVIAANLVNALNREQDSRVAVGYLTLLLGWMFEDMDAVNNFLDEGSNVQSLINAVIRPTPADDIVQGLCAMLLGVVYEFSTKDSPLPRSTLQSILLSRMGRETYLNRLGKLRSHPFMRDFEVLPQKLHPLSGTLPDVFFDGTFVDFFKDNYSRIARAIDRDPGFEISVMSRGIQQGISRELLDSLRGQLEETGEALETARGAATNAQMQLDREKGDHGRTREQAAKELAKTQDAVEKLRRDHQSELESLRREFARTTESHKQQVEQIQKSTEAEVATLRGDQLASHENHKRQLEYIKKTGEAELEKLRRSMAVAQETHDKQLKQLDDTHQAELAKAKSSAMVDAERQQRRAEAEAADLRATISRLEVDIMKTTKAKAHELESLRKDLATESGKKIKDLEEDTRRLREEGSKSSTRVANLEEELRIARDKAAKATLAAKNAEEARQSTQSELDDLLMVFADLEDKVAKYKARLVANGEEVSEGDDDDEDDDDDDEGSDDSDGEDMDGNDGPKAPTPKS